MTRQMSFPIGVAFVAGGLVASCVLAGPMDDGSPVAAETVNLGLRGVYFVPNEGQWSDSGVIYGLRSRGVDVAFRASSLEMHISGKEPSESDLTLGVLFPGSNDVLPIGAKPQAAKFNYFVGGEGRGEASNVPSYGEVVYENLYDGIDLHVRGSDDGVLKYEFYVAPGADYGQIRIAYDGIESLCVDGAGDLRINTSHGVLSDGSPVVWQEMDGGRKSLIANFVCDNDRSYRIAIDDVVDPAVGLVLDPEVRWMTYLGGTAGDNATGIKVDAQENIYTVGSTTSPDFDGAVNKMQGGPTNGFICKQEPDGTLLWMTYLGGSFGATGLHGVVVDEHDDVVVVGSTGSEDLPARLNSLHGRGDAFVTALSASGVVRWSVYIGGSQDETANGIVRDRHGSILISGETDSSDFEGSHGGPLGGDDVYVAKVSPQGELIWVSMVGGNESDWGLALTVGGAGDVYVCGFTWSHDLPDRLNDHHGGQYDGFLTRMNSEGAIDWSLYLGGSENELCQGVTLNTAGDVIVVGNTASIDFEGRRNSSHGAGEAFVAKVSSDAVLQWMTYLGGSASDSALRVFVQQSGALLVGGSSKSSDFEGRVNWFRGVSDVSLASVSSAGEIQWMMYAGGSLQEFAHDMDVTPHGDAYFAGLTNSTDFEERLNEHHSGLLDDAFVVKISGVTDPFLAVDATCPEGGPISIHWSDATPRRLDALLFGLDFGSAVIPHHWPCAGTTLGLGSRQLQVVWTGQAGPDGSRSIERFAGPNACGGLLQLLDTGNCATSNVVRIE